MWGTRTPTSDGAVDAEFAHAGLQGGAFHAEDGGGSFGAGDAPLGLAQDLENVLALRFVQGAESGRIGRGQRRADDGDGHGGLDHRRRGRGKRGRGFFEFGHGDAELFAGREEHGAFDEILQLADVAGPRVADERVHHVGGHVSDGFVLAAAEFLHEVAHQKGHVFGTLAQRRDVDGEDVEAVIKVAAEFALGDKSGEVVVGGGDNADIHADGAVAAEALELLFLKHAKEFRLEFQGKVADFVEEQRAAVGELEAANFLRKRAGERAALVAEKFGLQQPRGNGRAIDLDEGAFAAGGEIVDGAGDELFAGAGFTEDENSRAGGSREFDLRKGAAQERAVADNLLEIKFGANFFLEIEFFDGELVLEAIDFLEGQGVLEGDGDLSGDLLEEFHIESGESVGIAAGEIDGAESAGVRGQRHAADDLRTLVAKELNHVGLEAVNFLATRHEDLCAGDGATRRRAFERNGELGLGGGGRNGEIQGVDFQETRGFIEQGQAGVVVLDDGLQRRNDTVEERGDIPGGDEKVVDLKEDLQAVAFARELLLVSLSGLEVDGVVNGNGGLRGDALHEDDFGVGDALRSITAEAEGAEAMLRGGEGQNGDGANAGVSNMANKLRIARLREDVEGDKRLLMLPNPARRRGIHRQFLRTFDLGTLARFENVQAHGVARGVVKNQGEEIEGQDGVETLGELVEEGFEVALLGDGLADVEEGLELAAIVLDGGGRLGRGR